MFLKIVEVLEASENFTFVGVSTLDFAKYRYVCSAKKICYSDLPLYGARDLNVFASELVARAFDFTNIILYDMVLIGRL